MARVIAIANQKGGVGKTTTAINLSSGLTKFGKKVLLLDMDPQGNAGYGVGIDSGSAEKTMLGVLRKDYPAKEAIVPTAFGQLDMIPSNLTLASLEASLFQQPVEHPFLLLKEAMGDVQSSYDYIIIDCPPSLGLLSLNALAFSNSVLIPVQCEYFAMEAVAAILSTISQVQKGENPDLKIEGFLLTMYDSRTQLGTEIATEVRKLFKENTFLVSIPRNQSVAESQARQQPVTAFRPSSSGAQAYFSLAREVLDHDR